MNIRSTNRYDIFKHKKGNRKVVMEHVNRLVKSIKKNNMLSANPIIVNEQMYIIDGQHRLEAARILNSYIFYVVFNPASLPEIHMLNAYQKSWQAMDYMKSYIEIGKKDYEVYKEFREKYKLPHGTCLSLLMGKTEGGNLSQIFNEGNFKVKDLKKATETADEIMEIQQQIAYGARGSSRFYQALFKMTEKNDIKLFDFLGKLKISGLKIYPSDTKIGYLRQFEDVLNKGRVGKRIKLD